MSDVQILTLSCRDRTGITARVTGYLFEKGGNVLEAQQFNDVEEGDFFMRVAFDPGPADPEALRAGFGPLAGELGMRWNMPLPKGGDALATQVRLVVQLELVEEA